MSFMALSPAMMAVAPAFTAVFINQASHLGLTSGSAEIAGTALGLLDRPQELLSEFMGGTINNPSQALARWHRQCTQCWLPPETIPQAAQQLGQQALKNQRLNPGQIRDYFESFTSMLFYGAQLLAQKTTDWTLDISQLQLNHQRIQRIKNPLQRANQLLQLAMSADSLGMPQKSAQLLAEADALIRQYPTHTDTDRRNVDSARKQYHATRTVMSHKD